MSVALDEFEVTDLKPFTDAIAKASQTMGMFARRMEGLAEHFQVFVIEERCDYSDLFESQCAHCQGHVADFDPPRKVVIYDGA